MAAKNSSAELAVAAKPSLRGSECVGRLWLHVEDKYLRLGSPYPVLHFDDGVLDLWGRQPALELHAEGDDDLVRRELNRHEPVRSDDTGRRAGDGEDLVLECRVRALTDEQGLALARE